MKKVIIAEKPSVARNIADALSVKKRQDGYIEGDEYLITWAFGHLLQLFDAKDYDENMKGWALDKFPFIPEHFKYKIKGDSKNKGVVDEGAKKQLKIIKYLMNRDDVDGIISATDYDREGQLIADEIFLYCKEKKPIYRILLNEWTPDEVKKGMDSLKSNEEMKPLQDAGMGRQWADWLIGINLTSVTTVKYNAGKKSILNIGRVLLPTLKIIYDRDQEIENFETSTYYKLLSKMQTSLNETFEAIYYEKDQDDKDNEKFEESQKLEEISQLIKDKMATVIDKQVEGKKEYAPLLFNLTNLQGYITSKYKGWTSDKVLKVAQSLYEKKFITYPRTGSMALEESLTGRAQKVLEVHKKGLSYEEQIKFVVNKRIFDNSKVESHSAITPTYVRATGLSADEQAVYNAVKDRFIMQFLPVAEFEETKITMKVRDVPVEGNFISKGRVQLVEGWKIVDRAETKDTVLPLVSLKENVKVIEAKVNAVTKKPPKLHTEKTLLRVMESCGKSFKEDEESSEEMMNSILSGFSIGTPATRAETIKKLKDANYIQPKGKSLTCTPLGKNLVEIFPAKQLLDLEYTGKLEKTLSDIEKGKFQKEQFLEMIKAFTQEAVEVIKNDIEVLSYEKIPLEENTESVGICPICGNAVVENEKAFGCVNWKGGCKYTIWKSDKFITGLGKEVTRPMVELLLKNGKVGFKNLKSKKNTTFSAYLKYVRNNQTGQFSWEMEFINK